MRDKRLTPHRFVILHLLLKGRRFMTTRDISVRTNMSWNTAHKHLKVLFDYGWVKKQLVGNRVYWKINRDADIKRKVE